MKRMTAAQALVEGLIAEGVTHVFGIFGHGNVQLSHALAARQDRIRFITVRNEQAGVHAAAAIARLTTKPAAVTTSVGPGATNLVTGAAMAKINRWPVLLLPGEIFSENVGPVLQQIENTIDETANDSLRPVSKYWTRLNRASQLRRTLREAFDAMMEPGNEGPATICIPMDVQAESFEFDEAHFFKPRDRRYPRICADSEAIAQAQQILRQAKRPLIVAGGGVLRSGAQAELVAFAEQLGAPIAPTQAGKGCVLFDHPLNVLAIGPTGTAVGNHLVQKADVIIGVGTRYSDFTTASETAFASATHFININICAFDVGKQRALKLWGDAKTTLTALNNGLSQQIGHSSNRDTAYAQEISREKKAWIAETDRFRQSRETPMRQAAAIGLLNDWLPPEAIVISAAGTLPGELQKLWRDKDPTGLGYFCEYGYSTMGFEIAAGLGAKLALPQRPIFVLVGDMSFLMMSSELVTAAQLHIPFTVIVFDNSGGQSIRGLQMRSGFTDYGMEYRQPNGEFLKLDFAAMAQGMACTGLRANDPTSLKSALDQAAKNTTGPTVIDLKIHKDDYMGGYDSWWDVPQPELTQDGRPSDARKNYLNAKSKQVII